MADESVKISLFPLMPTTGTPPRLAWKCSLLTTAQVSYGAKYANENFQIPMDVLRSDFTGYIGIENIRPAWTDTIFVWRGKWWAERESAEGTTIPDRAESYTYVWDESWIGYEDYMTFDEKYRQNGLYFLTEAPIPLEEPIRCDSGEKALDPAQFTTKIVSKDYVDSRHNGFRKLLNSGSTLPIRPYTCYYKVSDFNGIIDITSDNLTDDIEKNRLTFYLDFNINELSQGLKITVDGKPENFQEIYGSSLDGVVKDLLSRGCEEATIELTAEEINGELVVRLTEQENLAVVALRSGYGDIQDNLYTFESNTKVNEGHGVDFCINSTASVVQKRLVNKDGVLQVQRGSEKSVTTENYLFTIDDQHTADSYSFKFDTNVFRDSGEHNKMTSFCMTGTLYHYHTHLQVNGSFIGVCSTEGTVQDEYEKVLFRVVDTEAEDERTLVDFDGNVLTFTTETRSETFGTMGMEVYNRHGEWQEKEVKKIDLSAFSGARGKEIVDLSGGVVALDDNINKTFELNLSKDIELTLDTDGLDESFEYSWRLYVNTDSEEGRTLDLNISGSELKWVGEDLHDSIILPPGSTTCIELTKVHNKLFAHILWRTAL